MQKPLPLQGPSRAAPSGKARQAVILLHGYGADGEDLISLAPYLGQALPETAFYAPNAPEPCEMSPLGRQWFSLSQYDPDLLRRNPQTMGPAYQAMADGVRAAAPALDAFIDAVAAQEGLGRDRIALLGFSQGCMMALHVGLRATPSVAAILGYSGAMVGADTLSTEAQARPPVLLVHGEQDPVVPFPAMDAAASALRSIGLEPRTLARPGLEHGIDEMGIIAGIEVLRAAFAIPE